MSKIRVCDICRRDMDDMINVSREYVLKQRCMMFGEVTFHKMDICERCMKKIVKYCTESNE